MMQVLFMVGLQVWGLLFALNWRHSLPISLIAVSGFMWGALAWVIIGVLDLISPLPFSLYSAQVGAGVLTASGGLLLLWHVRWGNWRLSRVEIGWLVGATAVIGAVAAWATLYNYTIATSDSWEFFQVGRSFGLNGVTPANDDMLLRRGNFVAMLQAGSILTQMNYDTAGLPVLATSGSLTFALLVYHVLRHQALDRQLAGLLALLLPLVFLSADGVAIHIYNIHANLTASWYLTLSLGLYWWWMQQGDDRVLLLGTIALIGYGLSRSEAPIFALFVLSFVIAVGEITPRQARFYLFPHLILMTLVLLSQTVISVGEEPIKLRPMFLYIIIGAHIALLIGSQLTQQRLIQRWLLPHIQWLLPLGLLLGLALLWDEGHLTSFRNVLRTAFVTDTWGMTWVLVLILTLLSWAQPPLKHGRFYWGLFLCYPLFLLILVTFRRYYRAGWGDSGSRMLIHILPSLYLYLTLKLSSSLTLPEDIQRETVAKIPRWGLLIGGMLLLLYGLYLWTLTSAPLIVNQ